ncbi:C40 family peptidase [Dactylosporangium sp. NPDC000521]|uniref:C40 family peptidase n=1 Tax=Dactylosporangium sp. NPDC000521 TaxID=3363975 RepID=UPI0036B3275D
MERIMRDAWKGGKSDRSHDAASREAVPSASGRKQPWACSQTGRPHQWSRLYGLASSPKRDHAGVSFHKGQTAHDADQSDKRNRAAAMNGSSLFAAGLALPIAAVVAIALVAAGSTTLTPAAATSACQLPADADGTGDANDPGSGGTVEDLDAVQVGNARIIYTVGITQLGLPHRAGIIAIATARQESSLRNLTTAVDHDSLGLFQQRPSQGWGRPEQLIDPVYASTAFYQRLVKVPDWQTRPLTDVAQAVQRSAYPNAYAKWEALAITLAAMFGDAEGTCDADTGIDIPGDLTENLPPGFTFPADTPPQVVIAASWALGQLGTSYHFGGTCTDPHGPNLAKHCDCSSLMQQAYKAAGISIPRVTTDQVRTGIPIPPSFLRAGDLIFLPGSLGSKTNPRHVGMYLGNGLVIHAPKTGDVVKIVKLQGYWLNNMVAARRIVSTGTSVGLA